MPNKFRHQGSYENNIKKIYSKAHKNPTFGKINN